jgi:DNA primase
MSKTALDLQHVDLLALIGAQVRLTKVARTNGGEYHGPCPFCKAGENRFHVWPTPEQGNPTWWCRACERTGDAVSYLRERDGVGFQEALRILGLQHEEHPVSLAPEPPEAVAPPPPRWQEQATRFSDWSEKRLWQSGGKQAMAWLQGRGLDLKTVIRHDLGYNPQERWDAPAAWGLPPDHGQVWLPRGIVIPWLVEGAIWKLVIRRPADTDGRGKYIAVSGSSNTLYNVDALRPDQPAVLTEGVFDALAVQQAAGELAAGVAAGTTWGRRMRWICALALCRPVLVAYDADDAGEAASAYWLDVLGSRARRWRPLVDDPAAMMQTGLDVQAWVEHGLRTVDDA